VANQAGLDQLDARRKRAERQVPKPHHTKAPVAVSAVAGEPAPAVDEERPGAIEASSSLLAPAEPPVAKVVSAPAPEPLAAPQRKPRSRQTQVLFDARADSHLSEVKKRAVMADVDLSASAVLRKALDEYVEAHGYDGIVAWFAEHGRQ